MSARFTRGLCRVLAAALATATLGAASMSPATASAAASSYPELHNDRLLVAPGVAGTVAVLSNDTSPDGFSTVAIESPPSNGSASLSAAHVLTYRSKTRFHGIDSVQYSVTDSDGDMSFGYVTVTVVQGRAVHALSEEVSGEADQPLPIDVLANDKVPDGLGSLSIASRPDNGSAAVVGDHIVYTPDADFRGFDWLEYRVVDVDGDYAFGDVSITIRHGHPVFAEFDEASVQKSGSVDIPVTSNDDVQDGVAELTIAEEPSNGTATVSGEQIQYVPDGAYQGYDSFAYTVVDIDGDSDIGYVDVAIVNGLPVSTTDFSVMIKADITLNVLDHVEQGDGPATVTLPVPSTDAGGALSMIGNEVHYTPPADFLGEDGIAYRVEDSNGDSAFGWVNVLVYAGSHAVIAHDDDVTVPVVGTTRIDALGNDEALDGLQSFEITSDPYYGSASIDADNHLLYTPDPDTEVDYLEYRITDVDGDAALGWVEITVGDDSGPGPVVTLPPPVVTPPAPPVAPAASPTAPTPPAAPLTPVKVTPTVSAALSKATAPLKSAVTMSGKVSTGSGATVTLQRKSGSAWVNVATAVVAGNGSYSLKVPTSVSGVSMYAVIVTGPTLNPTRSAAKTLSVYSASITKVKASGAEYVVIKNTGKVSISLSGMKLKDKAGKSLTLPRFTLAPGKSVTVFTGKGKSTTKLVHVGAKLDAWSTHDTTKLTDSKGALVSQKKY